MSSLSRLVSLAAADLRHDWLVSLCQVVLLAAVLTPLLLVFALKHGVTSTLVRELAEDPETLRLRPLGSYRLDTAFFERLRSLPDAGFAVPATRRIAAQMYVARIEPGQRRPSWVDVQMIPTAPGDPLAEDGAPLAAGYARVSLSAPAARQLGARAGDRLSGRVERLRSGRIEPGEVELAVASVLPERLDDSASVYVSLALLVATERYRDGFSVPDLGWRGERPFEPMEEFASLRVYASSLRGVAPLAAALRAQAIETRTRAAQIDAVLTLDRNLGTIFALLGALGAVGTAGALLASMVASVERKRRSLAVLALVGHGPGWLLSLPLAQALMIALAAFALTLVLYFACAATVNAYFAPSLDAGQTAAALAPAHIAWAGVAFLAIAAVPACVASRRAARIEPSEALRDI